MRAHTDHIILLLSTDWFLDYWSDLGIQVDPALRVVFSNACRDMSRQFLKAEKNYYEIDDFTDERVKNTESNFCSTAQKILGTIASGQVLRVARALAAHDLYSDGITTINEANEALWRGELSGELNVSTIDALMNIWRGYRPEWRRYDDACLTSKSDWDTYTRTIIPTIPNWFAAVARTIINYDSTNAFLHLSATLLSSEERDKTAQFYNVQSFKRFKHGLSLEKEWERLLGLSK